MHGYMHGYPPMQPQQVMPQQAMQQIAQVQQHDSQKFDRAVGYVNEVKQCLSQDAYVRFIGVLRKLEQGNMAIPLVIEEVSMLLAGNPHLLQGFTAFLPPDFRGDIMNGGKARGSSGSSHSSSGRRKERRVSRAAAETVKATEAAADARIGWTTTSDDDLESRFKIFVALLAHCDQGHCSLERLRCVGGWRESARGAGGGEEGGRLGGCGTGKRGRMR